MRATWTSFRPCSGRTWIVAHRGASTRYRESSPEAFESAIKRGVDAIETDVRRTADGVFVCHHDETLRRTAKVERAIADLTLAELSNLAPDYTQPLVQVLARLRGRCNVLLDLKLNGEDDIDALVGLLEASGIDDTVAVGVRSLRTHALLLRRSPELVQLGLLGNPEEALSFAEAGGKWIRYWEHEVTAARVAASHALGVPVLVMVGGDGVGRSVGEIEAWRVPLLLASGADGLMLNEPSIAIAAHKP